MAQFQPGQSGNPSGRPQGSRNKATLVLDELLDGQAQAITQKAVDLALAGDGPALRLCMERLVPPRKDRPVSFDLPEVTTAKEAANLSLALLNATANGEITPIEAGEVSKLVDCYVRAFEASELESRLIALEAAAAKK